MIRGRTLAWALLLFLILANATSALADRPPPPPGVAGFTGSQAKAPSRRATVQLPNLATDRCTTIDFEGLGDIAAIPNFDDIGLPGWLSIIEGAVGGTGNFSGEPSPVTVAFWLYGDPNTRDIVFANPVSKVGFYYASYYGVELDAFDADGNLLTSAFGAANYDSANNTYDTWFPLSVETVGNKIAKVTLHGYADYTGIDSLQVCRRPTIHSVEVTQAIQELQKIKDLESALNGGGDAPVPIVAGKPGVIRVYFDELQAATPVTVEVDVPGGGATKVVPLPPSCTPENQRRRRNGCSSVDFYFTPQTGDWTATVTLSDTQGNQLETHALPFHSRAPDSLVLRAVTVCDGKDGAGNWQCEDNSVLPGLADLLRRTAPTSSVTVEVTNSVVRVDRAVIPGANDWWVRMAKDVNTLYGLWDWVVAQTGTQRYYFGVVSTRAPGGIGGIANDIPTHGGGGRSSAIRLGVETNTEVVAHETGHMLGRRHTNTQVPAAAAAPPGCYNLAQDPATDWPYADNTIQSAAGPEVGFDVAADKPLQPESTFDWMSYCTPRWVSPFTYRHVLTEAVHGSSLVRAATQDQAVGAFWTVSGLLAGGTASLDPIFVRDSQASIAAGAGTHSIVVKNALGGVLFTRHFTPLQPDSESPGPELQSPAMFFELIPVQAGAARIVVLDPANAEIAAAVFGGTAPTVAFAAPVGGAILHGQQDVQWTIHDSDSSAWSSALEYSPDGGGYWIVLGGTEDSTLRVDFDKLPGSDGNALLRVFVSDGVNTGSAVSAAFAVPSHAPSVSIVGNGRSYFRGGDLVWLRADAYDRDDGVLDGNHVQWTSNRTGALGHGASLPVYGLPAGTHVITVTATDSDGNAASASEQITIAGAGPSVSLSTRALDSAPTTCVEITVGASPGSPDVPLAAVRYSLDGGASFVSLDTAHLPYTLVAPGSGFFHIVAHVYDLSGQWDVKDIRFFTATACQAANHPPVADAGQDRTVAAAANGQASVLLDGSHSTDPDSTPGTQDDIVALNWFEDALLPTETYLGSGAHVQVSLGVGVHHLLVQVFDKAGSFNNAQVTITVQAGPTSSSTTLGASANPNVFGQSVTFTATVTGGTPTGTVTFKDGAATLCNAVALVSGQAPCVTSALGVGSHSLTAVYSGDGTNAGSTSDPLTQVVNKASTSTAITAHTPNPSLVGAPIAVTASVAVTAPGAGTPTGTITVSDGSVTCPITLPATSCNLTLASAGAKTLTAAYAGDANFNGSTSPVVGHTVNVGTLDIDASITATKYDALTDGLLAIRYLFGLTGSSLTAGALGGTATRTDPAAIKAYLDGIRPVLDIDGDGKADALTDGLLIIRYLFGLRGNALIAGAIDPLATRTTAAAIEAYFATLLP